MSLFGERYKIVRRFERHPEKNRIMKRNLSLEEARAWCKNPETSSRTALLAKNKRITEKWGPWFDGFTSQ